MAPRTSNAARWPVLTSYDADHLEHIGLPLGGVGTGTVSLGGRGQLRDWELMARPAKGYVPNYAFFALWAQREGDAPVTRALEGAIEPRAYQGAIGCGVRHHGLPRFRACSFDAAYPFGQVHLSDADVPLDVRIEAFNPLVPADSEASGLPVAVLRFVLRNRGSKPVEASVCGSIDNIIGPKGPANVWSSERSLIAPGRKVTRKRAPKAGLQGLQFSADGIAEGSETDGTVCLSVLATEGVSSRTAWVERSWGGSMLEYWDDFSADGTVTQPTKAAGPTMPVGSLAQKITVPAKSERTVTFLLTWRFAVRHGWGYWEPGDDRPEPPRMTNYYATRFTDAWDAARKISRQLPDLEARTVAFVRSIVDADLPAAVKEGALYNVSTLRSQTCFRSAEGHLYGWEGYHPESGCCSGSCTHVWNYEQTTAFLFGDLARSMRDVEFGYSTNDSGLMNFRTDMPSQCEPTETLAAADGQMGCLLKLYRDWQLCGDDDFLRRLWPAAKRSLAFAWIPGSWDADMDGVMEGCQHNTMDVEYYGPNGQMQGWYLGALRAAEEMARYLGEASFADTCRDLFTKGSAWMDANLFNGEYYEHHILPPAGDLCEGLRHASMGARDPSKPDFQLGTACLVDQLVGQYFAHVVGLGYLHDPAKIKTTLKSLMRYNFLEDFSGHFNNMRSYVLGEESAMLMATYPHGERPKFPFPYFNEVMTGFEYTAAVGMLQEGATDDGLRVISAIRERYDGRKRNPFDEAECGHHYARAMAAWAAILAITDFHYSAVTGDMSFAAPDRVTTWPWSTGAAWGSITIRPAKTKTRAVLTVLGGSVTVDSIHIGDRTHHLPTSRTIAAGETLDVTATDSP